MYGKAEVDDHVLTHTVWGWKCKNHTKQIQTMYPASPEKKFDFIYLTKILEVLSTSQILAIIK